MGPVSGSITEINFYITMNMDKVAMGLLICLGLVGPIIAQSINVTSTGVGIGTSAPIRALHVSSAGGAEFIMEGTNGLANYRKWNFYVGGAAGGPKSLFLRMLNDAWNTTIVNSMIWESTGNVGIGTTTLTAKLNVNGTVRAKVFTVDANNWADYVFEPDYKLTPLAQVEAHIKDKKHLPGVPSEAELVKNGLDLGAMAKTQMAQIEQLMLHVIALNKQVQAQAEEIKQLKAAAGR
jgi:hypothetical protein